MNKMQFMNFPKSSQKIKVESTVSCYIKILWEFRRHKKGRGSKQVAMASLSIL